MMSRCGHIRMCWPMPSQPVQIVVVIRMAGMTDIWIAQRVSFWLLAFRRAYAKDAQNDRQYGSK
jgi:hypothetical protein